MAVAAVAYLGLCAVYLAAAGWNFTYFVHFSADYKVTQYFGGKSAGLFIQSDVHDGIAYYAIARAPFDVQLLGDILDTPLYRYRRFVYPFVVAAASFGQPAVIPFMLVAVNFFALLAGGFFLQKLLALTGLKPAWTLAYYFHPGLLLSFLYDLPTALEMLLVILSLHAYRRGRRVLAAVSLSAALCTWGVISMPLVVGIIGYEIWRYWCKEQPRRLPLVWLIPIVVVVAREIVLQRLFPAGSSVGRLEIILSTPFLGFWQAFDYFFQQPWSAGVGFQIVFLSLVVAGIFTALMTLIARRDFYAALAVMQGWMLVSLTPGQLVWPIEYTRKTLGLWLLLLLGYSVFRSRVTPTPGRHGCESGEEQYITTTDMAGNNGHQPVLWGLTRVILLATLAATLLLFPWMPSLPAAP